MNMITMMDLHGCLEINTNEGSSFHFKKALDIFNEFTTGNIVVCNKQVVKSFPGKIPLENRTTIIISANTKISEYIHITDRNIIILHDSFEMIKLLKDINSSNVWVIGGESMYNDFIPYANRIFVIKVHTSFNKNNPYYFKYQYFPIDTLNSQFKAVEYTDISESNIGKASLIEYERL